MRTHRVSIALPIETNQGVFMAGYSDDGLAELNFPPGNSGNKKRSILDQDSKEVPAQILRWHEMTRKALLLALENKTISALPPLDLSSGTDFQRRVWAALQRVPKGETVSYGQLAALIGEPRAARAVGSACGANPIPILIPCHRVLAANKKIGGFSGGLKWKRVLLSNEAILFEL